MIDLTVEDLVELPRRVVKQPTPGIVAAGDCGACVLAGLLGISVEDVYAKLGPKTKAGAPTSFGHNDMAEALRRAFYDLKAIDRYVTKTPMWPASWDTQRAWGDPSWSQSLEWREWLTMTLDAGYYAIALVRHTHEPMKFMTDHWVMYCGTRTKWDAPPGGTRSGEFELLVSDSARANPHEAWFPVSKHLKERGGFAVMLARPK